MSSSLLDRPVGTGLRAVLGTYVALDVDGLDDRARGLLLQEVTSAESMLAALRLRILASAERSATAARAGAASTGQWAARLANADQADAQRQVALAVGLEAHPATRDALGEGVLTPAHAAVIVRADRDLPPQVSSQDRVRVETALVAKARLLSPEGLRRAARRALAVVEADLRVVDAHEDSLVASEEQRAHAATRLTLHDNADGTVTGHFTVPTAAGQLLRKVLETMTAPRRGRLGASRAQTGPADHGTGWEHARGEAFCELLEHLPTDHLRPATAATLVVRIDEAVLRGALRAAQLDTGGMLSSGEARRLACGARLIPAVLGGRSVPLDLGRSARLFSDSQRTALGIRHDSCAADGCERPFAWCELHHRRPWSHGGRTDLADAVPLCSFHHRRIHDNAFRHTRGPDGSITFHART
jgi:hypothetical protein